MSPQIAEIWLSNTRCRCRHLFLPCLPPPGVVGMALPNLSKIGVIEQDIAQIKTVGGPVFQRIPTKNLRQSTALFLLVMEHIQKFQENHPRRLFIVKPMAPNHFVHPHRRRLVEVIRRRQGLWARCHGIISTKRGSGMPTSVNPNKFSPIAEP